MISKPFLLVIPFLLLLLPSSSQGYATETLPIQNISNPKIQDLGSYAVEQYDLKGESHLYFIEVVNGSSYIEYVTKGYATIYLFWLKAKNCSHPGPPEMYEARVYVQLFLRYSGPRGELLPFISNGFEYLRPLYT